METSGWMISFCKGVNEIACFFLCFDPAHETVTKFAIHNADAVARGLQCRSLEWHFVCVCVCVWELFEIK